MTQKKPDRWERMIDKQLDGYGDVPSEHSWFTRNDVIKLLRKEHQAVKKMVRGLPMYLDGSGCNQGHFVSVKDILDQLKKRAT